MASNSTQLIADAGSAASTAFVSATQALAIAAGGPIMDLPGNLTLVQRKLQECRQILAYVLEGSQVSTSLTAPTGGVVTSGNESTAYNLLVGIYQILK